MKNLFVKALSVLLIGSFLSTSVLSAGAAQLAINTPVEIQNLTTISSKNVTQSDSVLFVVSRDVYDANGNIAISLNTPVHSSVVSATSRKRFGKAGEVIISNFYTTDISGNTINLSGNATVKAADRRARSIVLSALLCPLFFFMKGADAEMPAGTTTTLYVAQ